MIITKVSDGEVKHIAITPDPLVGKRKNIPLDKDFEQMLISAERYACGRRTYIVKETVDYILSLLPHLSDWCITVMQNDMKSEFDVAERMQRKIGMSCDHEQWAKFRDALDEEMKGRVK